jgi:hypothetical protein
MHPFQAELTEILNSLTRAHDEIAAVHNQEMLLVRNKILQNLKREIDILKLQLGIEPDIHAPTVINPHAGPIKKIFGRDVTTPSGRPADVNKPFHQTPEDVAFAELKLKADELYPRFLGTSSDHLLDSVSDIEIRAVAKKAGLPVTEHNPARITTEYIETIKTAIQQQNSASVEDDLPWIHTPSLDLYELFPTTDNKDILETYTDPQIREVARKAGLPVTPKTPVKIDKKFLDQIKTAIKKQAELNAIAGV